MQLGAIDLGSNAIRILIASAHNFEGEWKFQRVEYLRYPIRLGEDVFKNRPISPQKIEKLLKLMSAFKNIFEVFEVDSFHACATSAMRDAINGKEIVSKIKSEVGIEIDIINGETEANLIDKAIIGFLEHKNYIHIDVGGGSTEINLIHNQKKLACKSFNIGTVRSIQSSIAPETWDEMEEWIKKHAKNHNFHGIGTGGNIKKLHELVTNHPEKPISLHELKSIRKKLAELSIRERMHKLQLNEDRADVIVPAADIFIKILEWADSENIIAPNVGLVDGIVIDLFEKKLKQTVES
jgi:exopolyphosphatase/guanosine-5'-triphosphate,3'-diphosphate pyrophosphatase